MYMVCYWSGDKWCALEWFNEYREARDYVRYESERDEYMTRTTGYSHIVDYKIEEV